MSALDNQIGGQHYRNLAIQPVEFIQKNGIGYLEGCALKYLVRHQAKGGSQDIRKAIHYCELILQMQYGQTVTQPEEKNLAADPHYQGLVQMFKVLDEVAPGWMKSGTTPSESAVAAIRGLKA